MLVRAPQLFHSIKPDESVEVFIELVNEGTRHLDNVRVEADVPLNWSESIAPPVVEFLDINEEHRIALEFTPPEDVSPGRYEVRVRTTSLSDDLPIKGEDKTVTIQVEPEANIIGISLLILFILALVVGIVVFGIRLSRRVAAEKSFAWPPLKDPLPLFGPDSRPLSCPLGMALPRASPQPCRPSGSPESPRPIPRTASGPE